MNMKKTMLIPLTALIFILTGCNEKVYDVDYYVNNIKEAEQMQKKCESGEVANQNCENARNALKQIKRKKTHYDQRSRDEQKWYHQSAAFCHHCECERCLRT